MTAAVSVVCALLLQQLQVEPYPGLVGDRVVVTASTALGPAPATAIEVELPDGSVQQLGSADVGGRIGFVPVAAGSYVFRATIEGVRVLAPHRVVARRERWWLALGSVPLGLALLWRFSRARGRRGP